MVVDDIEGSARDKGEFEATIAVHNSAIRTVSSFPAGRNITEAYKSDFTDDDSGREIHSRTGNRDIVRSSVASSTLR